MESFEAYCVRFYNLISICDSDFIMIVAKVVIITAAESDYSGGRKSAGSTKGADGKMCNRKTSTSLFPPIEVNNNVNGAGPSNAARKLSNVFAKVNSI